MVVLVERKLLALGVAGVILLLATSWTRLALGLDYMDLFGANVFERARGYQLSVAYISLGVVDARDRGA